MIMFKVFVPFRVELSFKIAVEMVVICRAGSVAYVLSVPVFQTTVA